MKSRAALINAEFELISNNNEGVQLVLSYPLN